jgi:hypothetical protein
MKKSRRSGILNEQLINPKYKGNVPESNRMKKAK